MAAWEASFIEANILKAFQATGLSPFDLEVILKRFNIRQPGSGSGLGTSSNSKSSVLSASNWRKTEGLLRQVVKDRGDPKAQKLSRAFYQISVQKSLLEHEAQGLKHALINERLRRKRGKALPLEAPEDYNGRAIFWSPRKVKEARERQHQQELEQQQQQRQKVEASRLRNEARQAKAWAIQARRQARAEARISREAEKASRAAASRTQQQLKQALKTSQKGKRMRLKAAAKPASKKTVAAEPQGSGKASGAAAAAPSAQSQHGRKIKLLAKFR
ncbi:hypothetical protein EJ02DRAFT_357699 [Clathrospora elynae]|uniref:Uncharacterized protein n=1 Tax=Clathrospora elynae TaxID=706981 RepID=A0A6A5S8Q2_9PLEO|nr:hypothetical protein EJ02DRAFT_357699 [Clathrospora elynae]